MNQTIEKISDETLVMIKSQAKLNGLSVDNYLRSLMPLENRNGEKKEVSENPKSKDRKEALKAWLNGPKSDAPALSLEEVSRESIY